MPPVPGFAKANRYIFDPKAWSWSVPSGHTCPGAKDCLAQADRESGSLTHGKHQKFRCYSAELERFPSVRGKYWANYEATMGREDDEVAAVLQSLLPKSAYLVRIHSAGDFYTQRYFDGWLKFARDNPKVHFYGFTKSVPMWVRRLDLIPTNLILQASYGGKWDAMIDQYKLKYARVVGSSDEARRLGLPVDTDDRLAAYGNESFALVENRAAMRERMVKLTVSVGGGIPN